MQKRGQGALEFLLTYGWAILILIVAVGTLAYFDLLKIPVSVKCISGGALYCEDAGVLYEESQINLVFRNNAGSDVSDIIVDVLNCVDITYSPTAEPVRDGERWRATLLCGGITKGDQSAEMKVTYKSVRSGLTFTSTATLSGIGELGTGPVGVRCTSNNDCEHIICTEGSPLFGGDICHNNVCWRVPITWGRDDPGICDASGGNACGSGNRCMCDGQRECIYDNRPPPLNQ